MHCNAGVLKCTGAPDSQSGVLSILCFTVQYDDFLQEKPICVIGKWGSLVSQLEPLSKKKDTLKSVSFFLVSVGDFNARRKSIPPAPRFWATGPKRLYGAKAPPHPVGPHLLLASILFPGFFSSKFHREFHRCKPLFQGNWGELPPFSPEIWVGIPC